MWMHVRPKTIYFVFDNCQLIALFARATRNLHFALVRAHVFAYVFGFDGNINLCSRDALRCSICISTASFSRSLWLTISLRQQYLEIFMWIELHISTHTHPTSTLKIHKYFSAVNWERMAQRDYTHTHTNTQWVKNVVRRRKKNTHLISMTMQFILVQQQLWQPQQQPHQQRHWRDARVWISIQWNQMFSKMETNQRKKRREWLVCALRFAVPHACMRLCVSNGIH